MKRIATPYLSFCLTVFWVWFCGCAPVLLPFDDRGPAQVLSYVGAPPVTDARSRFREIFCDLLHTNRQRLGIKGGCEDYLWRLNDESPAPDKPRGLPVHDPAMHILIVPGAFADCFEDIGLPFQDAAGRLKAMGYQIDTLAVSGLSSSTHNADIIAEVVANQTIDPSQRLVLIGYSKGTTDILHFLVAHPALARRLQAVLSVSGAVNGSALADRYSEAQYDNWLAARFPGKCQSGDRGVLDSLSRTRQFHWLATHPLPAHIRYFSLATFARYEDMQLFQRPTYKLLEKISPLNDGQLLFMDQLIPGSMLLGYVNTDHWTVATPVEEKYSNRDRPTMDRNRKLRALLFEAMILFVTENLNAPR